jgi:exopolysaccharide biosynthesis polyprenyl glycosylphosphotransferase
MIASQPAAAESRLGAASGIRPRPSPAMYGLFWSFVFLGTDVLVAFLAALVAQSLVGVSVGGILSNGIDAEQVVLAVAAWLLLFERIGMYQRSYSSNALDEVYASLAASALAMTPALLIFCILPSLHPFRTVLIVTLAITALGVSGTRFVAHALRTRMFPPASRRIAVVGTPERVIAVPRELSLGPGDEVVPVAVDDFDGRIADARGDVNQLAWLHTALDRGCHELIITEALPADMMAALLRLTESHGVKLAFASTRIRPNACDFTVRRDGALALLYPHSLRICTAGVLLMRRIFDLALALPSLLLLSPVFAAIAVAVFADSGKPIFYRQIRVGKLGREFKIIKFRTMKADAETNSGPVWARSGEDRTTRVGRILRRTSLDELPQLFNVVRGDMSIVGPRPERPFYVEQFRRMLPRYEERHLTKPGITGWSHIHMRRNVDTSAIGERLSYDLFYLENWSIFMDVMIIAKTGAEFLFHSAA